MVAVAAPLSKIRQYLQYRRVFVSHRDVAMYRLVRDHPERCDGPVALRLRGVPGGPLYARPGTMDPITLWDAFFQGYHLPTFSLGEPRVILDLGANTGYTAASFAAKYPDATVIAVELDADNAAICRENLVQFGNRCKVVHAGVWTESGTVTYGGRDVHDYAIGSLAAPRMAPAITVDDLLLRFQLNTVDYVKMDIEGAEASVLNPSAAWLGRVKSLSIEVHPPATMESCQAALRSAGFSSEAHGEHACSLVARRDL